MPTAQAHSPRPSRRSSPTSAPALDRPTCPAPTLGYRVVSLSRWPVRLVFRPRTQGLDQVPPAGCVIASSQLSNLDGVAVSYAVRPRQIRWLGKAELFTPVVGPALRSFGIVPVRRGEGDIGALTTMIRLARDGHAVGIFPEGTRRTKGWRKTRQPQPHTGAARIALAAGVPLVPAAVVGTERVTLLRRWRIAFGPPVSTSGLPDNRRLAARELTCRLMDSIAELESGLQGERRTASRLHPRHRVDVTLAQLSRAAAAVVLARRTDRERRVLAAWAGGHEGLVCLSVRTGLDLLLDALDLPAGDEIALSAITHPDMARVVEAHGLRPVPVDVDPTTLAPTVESLRRAIGPRTRVLVVAHLFGSRVELAPLAREGVLLVEDCAQSFRGPRTAGDPRADVSLFSFGSIKTATALGGALVRVHDPVLRERMRARNGTLPVQSRLAYGRRVLRFATLHALARPRIYALVAAVLGDRLDPTINGAVRGFPAGELLTRIRRQPSAPLLALLEHRLRTFDDARLQRRAALGDAAAEALASEVGRRALDRTHWVFPVLASDPSRLVARLRRRGFDASTRTTSITVIPAPAERPELEPVQAQRLMAHAVFLPVYPELGPQLADLVDAVRDDPR
jgi:dTDP-4-amino-4,6-dideoxygalactose transaminase